MDDVWGPSVIERAIRMAAGADQIVGFAKKELENGYEHHITIKKNKNPPRIHLHNIMDRLNYIWSN